MSPSTWQHLQPFRIVTDGRTDRISHGSLSAVYQTRRMDVSTYINALLILLCRFGSRL